MQRAPLAITAGDPCGIGPEITLRALADLADTHDGAPACLIFGSLQALRRAAEACGVDAKIELGTEPTRWPSVPVVSAWEPPALPPLGEVTKEGGRISYLAIEGAVRSAMAGYVAGLVTGPISKEALDQAGYPNTGHTELLGKLAGGYETCMMLVHDRLRVSHVSTHPALANVPASLTPERLTKVLHLTLEALAALGVSAPRIAVAALNPHGGEGGMFGGEDTEVSRPVIRAFQEACHEVQGPVSGDTVFVKAIAGEFDAVVAMYHDQGHIPVKLLGFRIDPATGRWIDLSGVNVTLGLPFVRTPVDHGTAFDIAGKGIASAQSMIEAIELAHRLADHRAGDKTPDRALGSR
jgi:4-hydroxythreonine-4-phosphate dehydrogenase